MATIFEDLAPTPTSGPKPASLSVAGLFAGIGGIELGLHAAGHRTEILCEVWPAAQRVLAQQFPTVPVVADIRELTELPPVDLVSAGFPCQDLSQAGRTKGITGSQSSLVENVFRLLDDSRITPRWVLFENVPFMLHLERGRAMTYLVDRLEEMGFRWAYRVVDARSFGLPQRRQRVLILASRTADPASVLFGEDAGEPPAPAAPTAFGFYWTEGLTGLGWAADAVPTIKGGSAIGISSPPAIWFPDSGLIGTPDVRDAERLQGFEPDWTTPAIAGVDRKVGIRWKLVGNAVNVPMAAWLGRRLSSPDQGELTCATEPLRGSAWPQAARGGAGHRSIVHVSKWPASVPMTPIADFLRHPIQPLSTRAADGFLERASRSRLRFPDGLLEAVRAHRNGMVAPDTDRSAA